MINLEKPTRLRKFAANAGACLAALTLSLSDTLGYAQQVDTTAPLIEVNELADGVADYTQVFTARIDEEGELQEILLYHRRTGEEKYTPSSMSVLGNTDYYSVTIDMDIEDLRPIEYYILARDSNNNTTVSGFSFDPYRRMLKAAPNPLQIPNRPVFAASMPSPGATETTPILQRRWVQVTLGVLAVGALASAASAASGDDSTQNRIVPLTFNLQ